ncbi:MAG: hypothetical protein P8I38_06495 [Arenicella sp.]|nr:hypothetical protein [Arenicella sp.]
MWSGLDTLGKIDTTLHSLRSDAVRVDQQLARLTQRSALAEQRRLHVVREIAKVRLAGLDTGELDADVSKADQEVKMLLDQREKALSALNQHIDQASVATQSQESARLEQLGRVNEMSQQIADTESQVQALLVKDQEYLAQLERATFAQSVATQSKSKVDLARANMAEKAVPYEADSLFSYLWDRGYGTTEYRAGLVARWLDGRLAKLIRFEQARVNYWNLMQIPKRLTQHAENAEQEAEHQLAKVQQIEKQRLEAAGVTSLSAQLDTLREELDRRDDELETLETELNTLLAERAKYIGGDDSFTQQCLSRLATAMDHRDLDSVYSYVLATSSLSDDELVVELSDLDQQNQSLKADLKDLRSLHQGQLGRLKDIEGVRRNFKNSRFDDVRSSFANQEIVVGALSQFVQGVLNGSELWGVIKRNQRYSNASAKPGFGSDGVRRRQGGVLGTPNNASNWHWPTPRTRGGGIGVPRPRGKPNGGFKTGGSF